MNVFFWVIVTAYWVIYFPFVLLGCWGASKKPEMRLLKLVDKGKYNALFVKAIARCIIIGTALIGGLIYFS